MPCHSLPSSCGRSAVVDVWFAPTGIAGSATKHDLTRLELCRPKRCPVPGSSLSVLGACPVNSASSTATPDSTTAGQLSLEQLSRWVQHGRCMLGSPTTGQLVGVEQLSWAPQSRCGKTQMAFQACRCRTLSAAEACLAGAPWLAGISRTVIAWGSAQQVCVDVTLQGH